MTELLNHLYIFLISMVPVIELRGAIPVGALMELPFWSNYLVSVIGNLLPVPVILLTIRGILSWMKTTKRLSGIALWLEEKAARGSKKVKRYEALGLLLFVAIPLPGTGAWTGALIAALMDMRKKYALLSILGGVLIAGVIMTLASYGVVGVFNIFMPSH